MGRSEKQRGHRRWGTELFGDKFGTTQNGGLVTWVNGALVPLGEDTLWKYGISFRGKKMRWARAQAGTKWGMHVWGVIEMYPPPDETILDIGKERLMPAEGGESALAARPPLDRPSPRPSSFFFSLSIFVSILWAASV
eukprot:COSAG05_NODE_1137_length_5751_cov_9.852619_2_plen_138_part_00